MTEYEILINSQEQTENEYLTETVTTKTELPVSKISSIAQGYLNFISEIDDEDDIESREALYSLMEDFEKQENQSGNVDDFHNFAVALARKDEYALACKVINAITC